MKCNFCHNDKVSVIIVNWNGEQFLERCLAALMTQTVIPHEIILVDNASSDKSVEIVRQFPSVQLMIQAQNTGFARGNNLAIAAASAESEWFALLNPDAFAEPRWLEALLAAAKSNPEFEVFGSKLINAADPAVQDGGGDAYHMSGLVWRMGHGVPVSNTVEDVREVFSPCAAAALYRRSVIHASRRVRRGLFLLRGRCGSRFSSAACWISLPLCAGVRSPSCRLGHDGWTA